MGRLVVEDVSSPVGVGAAVPLVEMGVRDGAEGLGVGNWDVWPFAVMFGLLDLRFVPKAKFLNLELIKSVLAMTLLEIFQQDVRNQGKVHQVVRKDGCNIPIC